MANETSVKALKEAFDAGFNAFCRTEPNVRGFQTNPPNPYNKNSLIYKEFERGFNRAYWENNKKAAVCE